VVESKRLAHILEYIQQQQELRDQARLSSPKLTRRQKERIEDSMAKSRQAPAAQPGRG